MNVENRLVLVTLMALLSGCASSATHYDSSAVAYLYPDRDQLVEPVGIPHLTLPINVGVAFVPDDASVSEQRHGGLTGGGDAQGRGAALTESEKRALLAKVSRQFGTLAFVQSIDIIPSAICCPGAPLSRAVNPTP